MKSIDLIHSNDTVSTDRLNDGFKVEKVFLRVFFSPLPMRKLMSGNVYIIAI